MRIDIDWRFRDVKKKTLSETFKRVLTVYLRDGREYFLADITINNNRLQAYYDDEREAAIAVDRALINAQKPPVNVLKKK